MSSMQLPRAHMPSLSRRRFLQAAGAGLFVLGAPRLDGWAQQPGPAELTGTHFDLQIAEAPFNFTGRRRIGTVVNGRIPGPLLRWRQGDTVTLRVANR